MGACSCIVVDDYDLPDFYVSETRRARKEYKCGECRRQIQSGETYEHVRGKWDGAITVYRTCVDCLSVRNSFFCDGFVHGNIWEVLEEHLDELVRFGNGVADSCIAPLTPRAREQVCDFVEEIWSEMDGVEDVD